MMWNSGHGMGWWMLIGSVWFVAFWGIVIWAVVRLTSRNNSKEQVSALDIAKQRYARGELNREQFEQVRKDLTT